MTLLCRKADGHDASQRTSAGFFSFKRADSARNLQGSARQQTALGRLRRNSKHDFRRGDMDLRLCHEGEDTSQPLSRPQRRFFKPHLRLPTELCGLSLGRNSGMHFSPKLQRAMPAFEENGASCEVTLGLSDVPLSFPSPRQEFAEDRAMAACHGACLPSFMPSKFYFFSSSRSAPGRSAERKQKHC